MKPDETFAAVLGRCAEALIPDSLDQSEIDKRVEGIRDSIAEIRLHKEMKHAPAQLRHIAIMHLRNIMREVAGIYEDDAEAISAGIQ